MGSVSLQLASLGLVAGAGAFLGFAWDLYRVLKAALGIRRSLTVFLCDLAFWISAGLAVFVLLLLANGAQLRLSTGIGLAAGLAVYRWTASPLVLWVSWNLASLAAGAARAFVALLWWVARRPRPWGVP